MSKAQPTYIATRNFNDAGTERSFEKGKPVEATEGEIINYKAAGLVTDKAEKADESAPAAGGKPA